MSEHEAFMVLRRKKELFAYMASMEVYFDGQLLGVIKSGQEISYTVKLGSRQAEVRTISQWYNRQVQKSQSKSIDFKEGQIVIMECGRPIGESAFFVMCFELFVIALTFNLIFPLFVEMNYKYPSLDLYRQFLSSLSDSRWLKIEFAQVLLAFCMGGLFAETCNTLYCEWKAILQYGVNIFKKDSPNNSLMLKIVEIQP